MSYAFVLTALVALVSSGATAVVAQDSRTVPKTPSERVDAAKVAYEKEVDRLRNELLGAFDDAIKRVPAGDDAKHVEKRTTFQNDRMQCEQRTHRAPDSPELKAASAKREKGAKTARDEYRAAVKKAAAEIRQAGNVAGADAMLTELAVYCPNYIAPAEFAIKARAMSKKLVDNVTKGRANKAATETKDRLRELVRKSEDGAISAVDLGKEIVALADYIGRSDPFKDEKFKQHHSLMVDAHALLGVITSDMKK